MKETKLYKNLILIKEQITPRRKNTAGAIFFDFFWKENKIITLPQNFYILPWGKDLSSRISLEQYDIYFERKEYGIRHYFFEDKYFYLAIHFSFSHYNYNKRQELYNRLMNNFFCRHCEIVKSHNNYDFPFIINNNGILQFASLLEKEVLDIMIREAEQVLTKIISLIECNFGKAYLDDKCYNEPSEEIFSFISKQNINFCSEVPFKIKIDMEKYFSENLMKELIKDIASLGLADNPFDSKINEDITEYKNYLLSLYGPGKWEWTNLDIEKLDLSIEELVCLHIIFNPFLVTEKETLENYILTDKEYKIGRFKEERVSYREIPYMYFWYKLKETILRT